MDSILKNLVRQQDDFLKKVFEHYGYTTSQLTESIKHNSCITQGNIKHYFVNKRYAFSIKEIVDYSNNLSGASCNVTMIHFHDSSMDCCMVDIDTVGDD